SRTMVSPELITKESADLMSAFNELQAAASTRIRIGSNWPLFEIFSDRMKRPKRVVDAYITPIVQSSLNAKHSSGLQESDDDNVTKTLLDYLVSRTDDSALIRDTLLAFLLAGRDTSASLLTFLTYALAMYPGVYQRLSAEINEITAENEAPSIEDIKSMRYLRATINETLRLFPPVPFNIRRSTGVPSILPSILSHVPGGLYMYPRCSITFSPLHIHRRKDLWGDDAEDFRPERWLTENSTKVHVTNPFAFIPFNGGPRMTLVRMVRAYTWSLSPNHQPAIVPAEWKSHPGRKGVEQCWPKAALTLYSEKKDEAKATAE
ncbi:Cytochrome P450 52A3, partial [Ceratobasidium sp. 392]